MPETLVEMKNITKTFPGVKALDDAQLTLYKGEVLGLLGENGAGKSTLMNVLGGVYIPDSGSISIDGKEAKITNVVDAQNLGVAFIHQEIALVPYLSVAENIFLGRERMSAGMVDKRKMYEEAKQWLNMVGLDVNPATMLCKLSIGRQQMVEIAKACSLNMKLLIMDEPTSSLSESEVDSLFEMIRKLKNRGIGIIYISHKLEEVFTITDRVCVMRDGGYVGTIITKESDRDTLVSMMVGRALDNYYTRTFNEPGEVVFEVKNINSGIRVKDCSFKVRKGEIVGFYGLVGAGRTELLETIFGIRTRAEGNVIYDGKIMNFSSPRDAMDHGFALITEERKANGLFLKGDITFNTTIANMNHYKNGAVLSHDRMVRATAEEIKIMHTKCMGPDDMITSLSGGNQQKVIFGKWLERSPSVFMMDDPTRGIDVGAKYEIYELIINMAKQGKTIIVVSSEMPEIHGITNRIGVMSNGRLAGIVNTKETNQEELLRLSAKYL